LTPALKQGSDTLAQWREGNIMEFTPWVDHVRFFLAKAFGIKRAQFQEGFIEGVNKAIEYLSVAGTLFAGHVIDFVINLLIMLFTLFFMFRDGQEGLHYLESIIPMRDHDRKELIGRIQIIVIGVVRGLFLTSLVQGVAATIGYLIVGAEGAVLLGA
jgi:predicted PurR-regulated permease PerM